MTHRARRAAFVFMAAALLGGCITKTQEGEKIRDLEFTVIKQEDIPEEMTGMIEEQKKQAFQGFYEDQGYLYIVEGYGVQETTGYSIEVEGVYETEYSVVMETKLLGPKKGEKILETKTYPFVVIKLESVGKDVQWR